jgi:hypothetical protein
MVNKMFSNKKGWIEILEAFISVMIVAAILLIVINKGNLAGEDISTKIYNTEVSILREIQTNDTLRNEISSLDNSSIPMEWVDFPIGVKTKIIQRTPNYLTCIAKICQLDTACSLIEKEDKSIYSQAVIISATLTEGIVYRKLNLFCWQKG